MSVLLDRAAFAALVSSHEASVFNFCARVLGSREAAALATRAAFLAQLREPPGDDEFLQRLLAAARAESAARIEAAGPEPAHADAPMPVRDANGRLEVRHREVLALRDLEGCSYAQISAIVGVDRPGVAELLWRARLGLRDELNGSRLTSIATVAEPCRRALPLIATDWDGERTDPGERTWLQGHLRTCGKCRSSMAAMREASALYRGWPAAPAPLGMRESLMLSAEEVLASARPRRPATGS